MNKREKNIYLFYLVVLLVIESLGTCLFLFKNYDFRVFSQKDFIITKMERIKEFQTIQHKNKILVDSLNQKIKSFNPGLKAVYIENDINFMINDLNSIYEKNITDPRYKAFKHASEYYKMYLQDKKLLWYTKENVAKFKRNLEECEIGLKDLKEDARAK